VHGLNDAVSLLGPLPKPWKLQAVEGYGVRYNFKFFNEETSEVTIEDPRLKPLENWERVYQPPKADDPIVCDYFRNKSLGEVMNSDPRMLPDMLEGQVDLRYFAII